MAQNGEKAGISEARIDVTFNDVESKIIGAAHGPNQKCEEDRRSDGGRLGKDKRATSQADHEEQSRLEIHPFGIREVLHHGFRPTYLRFVILNRGESG